MINRTKIKDSIYNILDEDPTKIQEYIDTEAEKTQEQKEKEKKKRNSISSITDVNLQENIDSQEDNPYNKIVIHTEKDNLVHNYFHYFDMYWDAGDCMSGVILKLPKTDKDNTKYWITYTGDVVVYLGNEINTEMHKSTPESNNETYFTLNTMKPIFKGEIGQIKEYNKELEIHIDSIGKRFKQKIPEEFRQSYINNQNVRDAFVAICQFLGVKYICPPGNLPAQDEQTENTDPQGDGTENNVEDKKNQEQQLAQNAAQNVADTINNTSNNDTSNNNTQSNDTNNQNNQVQNQLNESTQQNDIQNGFSDISFDANGAIVHGSVGIETSPDMEDTLLALEEHPLDKYLEDTTFIATDVKRFLNGEMFETVHNSVMNYGSITIEPKSSPTSEMSNTNMDVNNDGAINEEDAKQMAQDLLNKGKTGITLSGLNFVGNNNSNTSSNHVSNNKGRNGWFKGQLYENGKIVLSREYIRTLSQKQALEKYKNGKKTYTKGTLGLLLRRSTGDMLYR